MTMTALVVLVAQAVTFGDHVEVQCMTENACCTFHAHKSRTMHALSKFLRNLRIKALNTIILLLIHGNVT